MYLYIINAAKCWLNLTLKSLTVILFSSVLFSTFILVPSCSIGNLKLFNNEQEKMLSCMALAVVCILQSCYTLRKTLLQCLDAGLSFDILSKVDKFKKNIKEETNEEDEKQKPILEHLSYSIVFDNVSLNNKVPIFENISFKVNKNEKIGIFGLSSLQRKAIISILYKFTDISGGDIYISKYKICHLSTKNLRSLISVIPAEPYLFHDTIRKILSNDKNSTEDIVDVLKKFNLMERVNFLPNKIESVADYLLTIEEKQLLCLAEAYLNSSPIVIIEDFVHNSVLAQIIQTKLREFFPLSTIIIFANSNKYLNNCDSVIAFENGKLKYARNTKSVIIDVS